ncbi:MAG: Tll0287-like domain-containing protein [Parvularcula sp.]
MKTSFYAPLALAALLLTACGGKTEAPVAAQPDEADVTAARAAAKALGGQLKARLMAAMGEGGPAAAIEVCSEAAPGIAASVSADTGMTVGRTALRIRNPGNAPDAWETKQLEAFTAAVAEGADAAGLEVAEIVKEGDGMTLRYAKAIPMGSTCAMCHGENVSDEVKALIAARYPDDAATGFAPGEVRGMFTVSKPLMK